LVPDALAGFPQRVVLTNFLRNFSTGGVTWPEAENALFRERPIGALQPNLACWRGKTTDWQWDFDLSRGLPQGQILCQKGLFLRNLVILALTLWQRLAEVGRIVCD